MSHAWLWLGVASAGLSLFFALANLSLRAFSRGRLRAMLERRGRARDFTRLLSHHRNLLRATWLLYAVALAAMTALALAWAHAEFDSPAAWAVGAGIAAAAALTVGGTIPMAWARAAPESVLVAVLPVLCVCERVLRPAVWVLGALDALVRRLVGVPAGARGGAPIEEELRSVVREGRREGALREDQTEMIEGVIRFRKTDAAEIMTPRTDIVSLDAGASADEGRRLIHASGHSRIPVTEGSVDTVVGVLYAKDLLAPAPEGTGQAPVRDLMRPALFVPATKRIDELLAEFRRARVHMAIVLDEYGGTAGLVTIEDVVEEIVGEIADEYEEAPPQPIRRVAPGVFEVEARVRVDELNDELGLRLPENEDYETVGGLILSRLGFIPKAGQTLDTAGVHMTVLEAEERRILRVRVELEAPASAPPSGPVGG